MEVFNVQEKHRIGYQATSKGDQIKWYKDGYYFKADDLGYESVAEALISDLLLYIKDTNFVDYSMCLIQEGNSRFYGCYSRDFKKPGEITVSLYRLLSSGYKNLDDLLRKYDGKDLYEFVCTSTEDLANVNIRSHLNQLLRLDCITLNEDRHLNNICLLAQEDGKMRVSPIFDNGLSLLSDLSDYPLKGKSSALVRTVKSKPFSSDFFKQASYCEGEPLHINYKSFKEDLEKKGVPFKETEFSRAKFLLLKRLEATEGLVWQRTE